MRHSFYLDRNSIRVSVTHAGKQWRKATGLIIASPYLWNQKAKTIQAQCKDAEVLPYLLAIHSRLVEQEATATTRVAVAKAIKYALEVVPKPEIEPETEGTPTFWEYFREWGQRPSSSQRQRALAVRVVERLMGTREDWDDIDSAYWFKLNQKLAEEGYSVNYRWNIGTRLKCVLHEGYKLKYHRNDDFRDFKVHKEQTEAIALTPAEIEMLWEWKPTSEVLAHARDLALVGYYSAARFSDFSRLSSANIHEGRLVFTQQKTGDRVVLPVSPRLQIIFDRNGGRAPKMCMPVFNRQVKRVARLAGIDGEVDLPKAHRKKDGSPTYRWEMVQSHTFRRSALTNLYLSGVPMRDCMYASGHKSLSAFQSYLRVGKDEAVGRLSQSEFFK